MRTCDYVVVQFSFLYYVIVLFYFFFFFKQKTAYEMRISDWSSDVCSSDLLSDAGVRPDGSGRRQRLASGRSDGRRRGDGACRALGEEQGAELLRRQRMPSPDDHAASHPCREHGRASGRERVCQYG